MASANTQSANEPTRTSRILLVVAVVIVVVVVVIVVVVIVIFVMLFYIHFTAKIIPAPLCMI